MNKIKALFFLPVLAAGLCLLASGRRSDVINPPAESDYHVDTDEIVGNFEVEPRFQWHSIICKDVDSQFLRVTDAVIPVRQGRYAARFTVRPGDQVPHTTGERCEAAHYADTWNHYSQEQPGDDYYYGWSTYIPDSWVTPSSWSVIAQWHHRNNTMPPIAFNIKPMEIGLKFFTGQLSGLPATRLTNYSYTKAFTVVSQPEKNVWHDFIVHIHFAPDSTGLIEVWHKLQSERKFAEVISEHGIPTMQSYRPEDWSAIDNEYGRSDNRLSYGDRVTTPVWCRIGLYRNESTFTSVIYHDNWARARSYESILNNFY
jgi:Polysaccharide lyase